MRIVALEEAFWLDTLQSSGSFVSQRPPIKGEVLEEYSRRLSDFTMFRLPEMDRYGVDVQVLSLTSPGIQMQPQISVAVADARAANDFVAELTHRYPRRFAGLAALPLQDPDLEDLAKVAHANADRLLRLTP